MLTHWQRGGNLRVTRSSTCEETTPEKTPAAALAWCSQEEEDDLPSSMSNMRRSTS